MKELTEDQVRDKAQKILRFIDNDTAKSGVGQLTSFNQLGFTGIVDRPDGWYLPKNKNNVAIILEVKASKIKLENYKAELLKNINIVLTKYNRVIGILYNGYDIKVYKNNTEIQTVQDLQNKEYYIDLFTDKEDHKQEIYRLTKKINDCLHIDFGIKNLYHRMIFTACTLVAKIYGANINKGMRFDTFRTEIKSALSDELETSKLKNQKLQLLIDVFSEIKMNSTENQVAIDNFIDWVNEISQYVADSWNGEDVMAIFFNEFNRYKKKSESGQVFTPEHVASLMYKITEVSKNDVILDAACGSGTFLVKSMYNMIIEAGGEKTDKAQDIKNNQLYGIEFDREIFALACANMLIHNDGKTNLTQLDSRSEEACKWISNAGYRDINGILYRINKVLMNPPFENKFGCMTIVENVLNSVQKGSTCAFILPDKKLEKVSKTQIKRILAHHRLKKIIKLPEKVFLEGVTTSVFIFETGVPQNNKEIFTCYIENDGLETVKNQGRQDIKDRWQEIENHFVNVIHKQSGDVTIQWIKPSEHLSYQVPLKPFEITEEDFNKTIFDFIMYENRIDFKEFNNKIFNKLVYSDKINSSCFNELSKLKYENIDISNWKEFKLKDLFRVTRPVARSQTQYTEGEVPFVASGNYNNGVLKYLEPKKDEELDIGNCITISPVDGSAFYQKNNFLGRGGAGSSILILRNEKINEYNGLFFSTVIRIACSRFFYSDMANSDTIKEVVFKLPITSKNEIDYEYMERYIKKRLKLNYEKFNLLKSL